MALEDAVCIAEMMSRHDGDPEVAFADYQSRRIVRTARIQLDSRAIGDHIYHPSGAHALVRNEIMQSLTPEDYYDRLSWLYGGTGLDAA